MYKNCSAYSCRVCDDREKSCHFKHFPVNVRKRFSRLSNNQLNAHRFHAPSVVILRDLLVFSDLQANFGFRLLRKKKEKLLLLIGSEKFSISNKLSNLRLQKFKFQ